MMLHELLGLEPDWRDSAEAIEVFLTGLFPDRKIAVSRPRAELNPSTVLIITQDENPIGEIRFTGNSWELKHLLTGGTTETDSLDGMLDAFKKAAQVMGVREDASLLDPNNWMRMTVNKPTFRKSNKDDDQMAKTTEARVTIERTWIDDATPEELEKLLRIEKGTMTEGKQSIPTAESICSLYEGK